jgi:hypothetical protein
MFAIIVAQMKRKVAGTEKVAPLARMRSKKSTGKAEVVDKRLAMKVKAQPSPKAAKTTDEVRENQELGKSYRDTLIVRTILLRRNTFRALPRMMTEEGRIARARGALSNNVEPAWKISWLKTHSNHPMQTMEVSYPKQDKQLDGVERRDDKH